MKKVLSILHQVLGVMTLLAILLEFFFAGTGVFQATSFQIHRLLGVIIWGLSALLLLVALLGRMGKKTIGLSALLFVLMFIQSLLVEINQPFVKALHPLNGVFITIVTGYILVQREIGIIRK